MAWDQWTDGWHRARFVLIDAAVTSAGEPRGVTRPLAAYSETGPIPLGTPDGFLIFGNDTQRITMRSITGPARKRRV